MLGLSSRATSDGSCQPANARLIWLDAPRPCCVKSKPNQVQALFGSSADLLGYASRQPNRSDKML